MDSGSTSLIFSGGSIALAIVLLGSVLAFLGLHAAGVSLPLLRRAVVRDSLSGRGVREAAVSRLRSERHAYEDLILLLLLLSMASASVSALALLTRLSSLHWAFDVVALAVLWVLLLLFVPVVQYLVGRLTVAQLVTFGTLMQGLLWPLLPIRRFSRTGLRFTGAEQETESTNGGFADTGSADGDVHDEIENEPLERHEREMIRAILHLDETPVREIMAPRVDVVSVDVATGIDRAATRMLDSGHSRLPVYEDTQDNVIGILYSRDLLAAFNSGGTQSLRDLLRPVFFVPESKRVAELLREFQERHVHMAIVVDEYGSVAGIVTIEDLLEEIVGEIEDEFDTHQPNLLWMQDGEALVEARMPVDDFNEMFKTSVVPEGFDTVGGFLFSRLGRIPTVGDKVEVGGLEVLVTATSGRRVRRVRVRPIQDTARV